MPLPPPFLLHIEFVFGCSCLHPTFSFKPTDKICDQNCYRDYRIKVEHPTKTYEIQHRDMFISCSSELEMNINMHIYMFNSSSSELKMNLNMNIFMFITSSFELKMYQKWTWLVHFQVHMNSFMNNHCSVLCSYEHLNEQYMFTFWFKWTSNLTMICSYYGSIKQNLNMILFTFNVHVNINMNTMGFTFMDTCTKSVSLYRKTPATNGKQHGIVHIYVHMNIKCEQSNVQKFCSFEP